MTVDPKSVSLNQVRAEISCKVSLHVKNDFRADISNKVIVHVKTLEQKSALKSFYTLNDFRAETSCKVN
jgi:hypothetical protein